MWKPIAKCPDGTIVIGVYKPPNSQLHSGVIMGVKYDLRPDCIFDWQAGKWKECTHFCLPPE